MAFEEIKMPLISVVIPVFNGAKYLEEALQSIENQENIDFEIIVIDDGSTDATAKIVETWPRSVQYIYQSNQGPAHARNVGIKAAKGNFIAFLDADDTWPSGKIATQIALLNQYLATELVWSKTKCVLEDGILNTQGKAYKIDPEPNFIPFLGAALFRKTAFDKVGLFDISLRFGEDIDWYNRACEMSINILKSDTLGLYYRMHNHNSTRNTVALNQGTVQLLKKKLDRNRQISTHG